MTDFQPRYTAYARSHGREPADQLAHDRDRCPVAVNVEFMSWVRRRWDEWETETGHVGIRTQWDHQCFDRWLTDRTDRLHSEAERLLNSTAFLAEVIACERLAEVVR